MTWGGVCHPYIPPGVGKGGYAGFAPPRRVAASLQRLVLPQGLTGGQDKYTEVRQVPGEKKRGVCDKAMRVTEAMHTHVALPCPALPCLIAISCAYSLAWIPGAEVGWLVWNNWDGGRGGCGDAGMGVGCLPALSARQGTPSQRGALLVQAR